MDLIAVIREVIDFCGVTFDRKIAVERDGAGALPEVYGNSGQLKQLMLNLCINARDALETLPGHGPEPRIIIGTEVTELDEREGARHGGLPAGAFVRFYVSDNGPGMSAEVQKRVFEPFFTTKEVGQGTGLGLATAYGIASQHNGWIGVDSQPGEGATFEVLLPVAVERRARPREDGDASLPSGVETLLVVDDDQRVRQVVGSALRKNGYTVVAAADGIEGLEIFRRDWELIDVVVLDVSMPRMSGDEVLREMIGIDSAVKALIMTGYATDRGDFSAAAGFVQKPLRLPALQRAVRRVLDG